MIGHVMGLECCDVMCCAVLFCWLVLHAIYIAILCYSVSARKFSRLMLVKCRSSFLWQIRSVESVDDCAHAGFS
jgi:hypothetical protein